MPSLWLLAALASVELLELHGPDNQQVFVNPQEITTLRSPSSADLHRYFPRAVHCVIVTTNGRFLATIESCATIRDRIR